MLQASSRLSAKSWRALLLYSGALVHDRGMTSVTSRFLALPGKIKKLVEKGGVCALASALNAHHAQISAEEQGDRAWVVVRAAFIKPLDELLGEQRACRSKSWSNRPPKRRSA